MVIIKGLAFPLNTINNNQQGIPATEADNAINSLKNSVVRVCNRNDPHGCEEDPLREIGRVTNAWLEADGVHAEADITDSIAARKIDEKTWTPGGWSVYANVGEWAGQWATGIEARSLTLVDNPAWDVSQWHIAAATEDKKSTIRFYQIFTASGDGDMTEIQPEAVAPEVTAEVSIKEPEEQIKKMYTDDEYNALEAQRLALYNELNEVKNLASSKLSIEEVNKIVASKTAEAVEAKMAEIAEAEALKAAALERESAVKELTEIRAAVGLETDPAKYDTMSAATIVELAKDYSNFKSNTQQTPVYASTSSTGSTVGSFDSKNNKWRD